MKLSKEKIDIWRAKETAKNIAKNIKVLAFAIGVGALTTGCSFEFETDKDPSASAITEFAQKIKDSADDIEWDKVAKASKDALQKADKLIQDASKDSKIGKMQKATLVRVVDGDTIVVKVQSKQQKVRLIGVDTPESVASAEYLKRTGKVNSKAGKDASAYTKEILKKTKTVYLQKDKSNKDKYGRLLRYVWIKKPKSDTNLKEIATKMLNGILVRDHIAKPVSYKPDTKHKKDFQTIYDADYDTYR